MLELALLTLFAVGLGVFVLGAIVWGLLGLAVKVVLIPLKLLFGFAAGGVLLLLLVPLGAVLLLPLAILFVPVALFAAGCALVLRLV